MTEVEARAELEILTDHLGTGGAPALSHDEISLLIRKARRADQVNRAPSDAAWEPTYNLPYAAAIGWRLKAGKCANKFDFRDANGNDLKRSQVRAHCVEQAKSFANRAGESVSLAGGWRRRVILGETNAVLEEDLD